MTSEVAKDRAVSVTVQLREKLMQDGGVMVDTRSFPQCPKTAEDRCWIILPWTERRSRNRVCKRVVKIRPTGRPYWRALGETRQTQTRFRPRRGWNNGIMDAKPSYSPSPLGHYTHPPHNLTSLQDIHVIPTCTQAMNYVVIPLKNKHLSSSAKVNLQLGAKKKGHRKGKSAHLLKIPREDVFQGKAASEKAGFGREELGKNNVFNADSSAKHQTTLPNRSRRHLPHGTVGSQLPAKQNTCCDHVTGGRALYVTLTAL
ncbi:hypothetical protein Bbelb_136090 [Branchiostoma belcheri]|nr:hypothetical protein Bbelb_136090 [Branchiostoma belcheri]